MTEEQQRLLEEYKDAAANMRHYGIMRFTQLSLFAVISGGIAKAFFSPGITVRQRILASIIGFVVSMAFWIMEESAADNWWHFHRRASALEPTLGYQQFTTRRSRPYASATNATRLLLITTLGMWLQYLVRLTCCGQ